MLLHPVAIIYRTNLYYNSEYSIAQRLGYIKLNMCSSVYSKCLGTEMLFLDTTFSTHGKFQMCILPICKDT